MKGTDQSRRGLARLAAAAGMAASGPGSAARAQPRFPDRPVRLLLPAPPGGPGDAAIRALAAIASHSLGQPVVVEHRPGAGATLAARAVRDARPDGQTLAVMPVTVFRLPLLMPSQAGFDPRTDFTWVIQLTGLLMGLVVRAESPWRSFPEFLEHARGHPGRIAYGFPGVNTTELPLEIIARREGIEWNAVPFRGGTESLQALLGGQIDAIAETSSWMPHVEAGRLRLLVVYSAERVPRFPEVPTLREFGITWPADSAAGIAGPRGMEPAITRKLHDAFREALFDPSVQRVLERFDMPVNYLGSEDYAREAARLFEQERDVLTRLGRLPPPG
ncbi:tripartite tricarboxylate transporter substrate binding protein [Roseococcus sp. SYP-B2431]|uniref:tripartite tricarboxylate transporter substrate binding protein n=1 Tax=Roseococcus sp. SYP-B2431 TaxID=2496640 RepID=UPI001040AB2F|nr:tripartite tricarboxylate transporter substrate binding protein [Roseococcus sp. SYP-B2431]TCH98280.1 tripartite tricarboxylate transporter substrate binding protein [Roseococcus sp. SYP-B2431]